MVLIMTFTAVTFTSCSNDDTGDGDPAQSGTPSGVMVAKVNGNNFQSLAVSSSATIANDGQNLVIIASSTTAQAFSFSVFGFDGTGTYPLGGGANIFNIASYSETDVDLNNPQNSTTEIWQAPYDDTVAGELVITEITDTKVKGTFSFSCKNVGGDQSIKNITNGSFNLSKQVTN